MKNTWLDNDETKTVLELRENTDPNEAAQALASLKRDYEEACKLIAQMHGAAIGEYGGAPKRGIVEDIVDLYREVLVLRAENEELKKQLVQALRHTSSLQDIIAFGGVEGIASIKKKLKE